MVVLDVMMPKMDGYGVTREIRRTSDVPIIILTALGDVSERITGLELVQMTMSLNLSVRKNWKLVLKLY